MRIKQFFKNFWARSKVAFIDSFNHIDTRYTETQAEDALVQVLDEAQLFALYGSMDSDNTRIVKVCLNYTDAFVYFNNGAVIRFDYPARER